MVWPGVKLRYACSTPHSSLACTYSKPVDDGVAWCQASVRMLDAAQLSRLHILETSGRWCGLVSSFGTHARRRTALSLAHTRNQWTMVWPGVKLRYACSTPHSSLACTYSKPVDDGVAWCQASVRMLDAAQLSR